MASIRGREKADGTEYFAVVYRHNGKQTSTSFADFDEARRFCELVNKFGPDNALSTLKLDGTGSTTLTVEEWLTKHIESLTGPDANTVSRYRAYVRRDIGPVLGSLPLSALTRDHIVQWVKGMQVPDVDGNKPSSKTLANKRGFLAGALNAAVPNYISSNPCVDIDLPEDDEAHVPIFLKREQFTLLHDSVTEYWRPLVEFLVASGARFGEVAALRPSDVDREAGTVRIVRTWKQGSSGYRLGPPKTKKSRRTINVPKSVLDKLDYSYEYLFVNREGGPVRAQGFFRRVWQPALERAWPSKDKNGQEIKHPFRPRVHDLRHTNASWLIQAGIPLPVVQDHLGHEDIRTTVAVYGHLDRTSMQAAADVIGSTLEAMTL